MNGNPCLHAQNILIGTAKVERGFLRGTGEGDSGKEWTLPIVEVLDEAVTFPSCPPTLWKECLVALPAICAADSMLPSRYAPRGHLVVNYESTICVGGVDVRCGTLGGVAVAVKTISSNSAGRSGETREDAYREVVTWKNLNHENILPLLGVDTSISPLSAVSERAEYGSLREYLTCFPNALRSKLLLGASQGLGYMHGLDCIHGDLKGSNILVKSDHSAVLANFRSSSFLPDSEVDMGVSIPECDLWSVRWLAPELLFPEKFGLESARLTKETDIYAFAMVMYEVFSGSFPFKGLRNEASMLLIRSGDHPHRPKNGLDLGLTDELWKAMKACWKRRDSRWKIPRIVSILERHSVGIAVGTELYPQGLFCGLVGHSSSL